MAEMIWFSFTEKVLKYLGEGISTTPVINYPSHQKNISKLTSFNSNL